jgi:hypothetical protein
MGTGFGFAFLVSFYWLWSCAVKENAMILHVVWNRELARENFQRNASKHKIQFLQCACLNKAEAHLLKQ